MHGLLSGAQRGQPVQGFYLLTPLELRDGSVVIVNRGFVPTELRDPATPARLRSGRRGHRHRADARPGEAQPRSCPRTTRQGTSGSRATRRDRARARALPALRPSSSTPGPAPTPGGWPRAAQTRLAIPNDHLEYALTWFGLALTLAGVFGAFAWRRRRGRASSVPSPPEP